MLKGTEKQVLWAEQIQKEMINFLEGKKSKVLEDKNLVITYREVIAKFLKERELETTFLNGKKVLIEIIDKTIENIKSEALAQNIIINKEISSNLDGLLYRFNFDKELGEKEGRYKTK